MPLEMIVPPGIHLLEAFQKKTLSALCAAVIW